MLIWDWYKRRFFYFNPVPTPDNSIVYGLSPSNDMTPRVFTNGFYIHRDEEDKSHVNLVDTQNNFLGYFDAKDQINGMVLHKS